MRIYMFVPILVKIGEGKRESHQNDAPNSEMYRFPGFSAASSDQWSHSDKNSTGSYFPDLVVSYKLFTYLFCYRFCVVACTQNLFVTE